MGATTSAAGAAGAAGTTVGVTMEAVLRAWARELSADTPGLAFLLLRSIRGSWLGILATLVHSALLLLALAQSRSAEEARVPLRLYVGAHASLVAQYIFWRRRHHFLTALQLLRHVAASLSEDGESVRLRSGARTIQRLKRFYAVFYISTISSVLLTVVTERDWLQSAIVFCHLVVSCVACACCIVAYYSLLSVILAIHLATGALYRELGRRLQLRGGGPETAHAAVLHAELKAAYRSTDVSVGWLLPHYLLVGLVMPLVSTAEVILAGGRTDSFALGSVPLVVLVFAALCFAGQFLQDCSGALPGGCYLGPWLEESPAERRVRLLLMLAARRPLIFRVKACGNLNRPTCVHIMRSWFSYLQVLIKFSN